MTNARRRVVVVSGVAVVVIYLVAAAVSGRLSPLARRPLLDGTLPPTAYRWVDPPPALAAENDEPTPGTFRTALTANGSAVDFLVTQDQQVSVVLPKGAFPAAPGQRAVEVTITPISPAAVAPAEPPLEIVGNVATIEARYLPSGDVATPEPDTVRVVLFYPVVANQHGGHSIVTSPDGRTWTAAETNDLPSIQQADAVVPTIAYVAAAIEPSAASPSASPAPTSSVATIAIVAAIVVLVAALIITLRRRR